MYVGVWSRATSKNNVVTGTTNVSNEIRNVIFELRCEFFDDIRDELKKDADKHRFKSAEGRRNAIQQKHNSLTTVLTMR